MFRKDCFVVAALLLAMTHAVSLCAEPADYTVLLKKFELKNEAGRWIPVLEPDRVVHLAEEEARVLFFNTTGRVPDGRYVNFRLTLADGARGAQPIAVTRKTDLSDPLEIRKGSFLFANVVPVLENPVRKITEAKLTVDDRALVMQQDEISVE